MKLCNQCGTSKPLEEFYAQSRMSDGHMSKCKVCTIANARQNYRANREQYLAYEKLPKRVASRHRRSLEQVRRHRTRYPEKARARAAVSNALRDGRLLKQPCAVCGDSKVEAHHTDYNRPLDVAWFCHQHHREIEGRAA